MTILIPQDPTSTDDSESYRSLKQELDEATRRWQDAERTRSTLTVVTTVMAGMALVASIVAWGFAESRGTSSAATPVAAAGAPSGSVTPTAFVPVDVPVTLADFRVTLPATTVTSGTKSLQISNAGTVEHELLVFQPSASIDPNNLPVDKDGNIIEDAPGINKVSDGDNITAGQSQARSIDLSVPGTYVFVCNLPGHYRLGMHTVVRVVTPNASSEAAASR